MTATENPRDRRAQLTDPIGRVERLIEIRLVEEKVQQLYNDGHIRGSTHLCNGQEAVAVGIAASTRIDDTVTCTYRGHGHALALGSTPTGVLAELCGRATGSAGGVGGSMHLVEASVGLLPTFAIVGAGLPVACGAALAAQTKQTDQVAVAVFGDGSTNIGAFHESLNFASIRRLPVIFVCENNLYGEYSPLEVTTPVTDIATRATSYAMPSAIVDGQSLDEVIVAVTSAVERARRGDGPTLLEMKTYRYSGHSRSDPASYRPAGELDRWLARDPITIAIEHMVSNGIFSSASAAELWSSVMSEVERAAIAALDSPAPEQSAILKHVRGH